MTDYRPIACAAYERLELAILHRERLRLRWQEGTVEHIDNAQAIDLITENGAEFLLFRDSAQITRRIRLDQVRVL